MKEEGINSGRRNFFAMGAVSLASMIVGSSCRQTASSAGLDGKLKSRPRDGVKTSVTGQLMLGLDHNRDAILHVPKTDDGSPLPLLIMLHGATQSAEDMFWYLGSTPDDAKVAVLAPNAREMTWDVIRTEFGPDVEFIDRALSRVFETVSIDRSRLAIGGFSDGATYAISLGLINGDLFTRVVAFSPGYVVYRIPQGKPAVFISHGTRDRILPINSCGLSVAVELKRRGYQTTFREFDGGHEIPEPIAREGLSWIASSNPN
jgi:phospholipase/carboxylesterase